MHDKSFILNDYNSMDLLECEAWLLRQAEFNQFFLILYYSPLYDNVELIRLTAMRDCQLCYSTLLNSECLFVARICNVVELSTKSHIEGIILEYALNDRHGFF